MISYIIRRLLLMIPTLIGITLVVFLVMAWSPGGVGASLLSQEGAMRPEERAALRKYYNKRYGLDKPVLVQYLRWLNQVSPVGFPVYDDDVPEMITGPDGKPTPVMVKDKAGKPAPRLRHSAGDIRLSLYKTFQQDVPETRVDKKSGRRVPVFETLPDGPQIRKLRHRTGDRVFWLFKTPDLGESFVRGTKVVDLILNALPITVLLNLITIPVIYGVSITSGIMAARHRGKLQDVGVGAVLLGLWSVPSMLVGVLLIGCLANRDVIQIFPTGGLNDPTADTMTFLPRLGAKGWEPGWLLDAAWHLVLPVLCMTYGHFAFLSKLMRSAMLENLSADFVRTARAKGLSSSAVLYRHALRNSLLPLITVVAGILPGLLAGSVIVESIFSINGMGKLMIEAVTMRDRELILAETLVISLLSLVCLLIADLLYALADPRVSYE